MLRYIVGRIGQSLLLLFLVSIIGYFVLLLSRRALVSNAVAAEVERATARLGRPMIVVPVHINLKDAVVPLRLAIHLQGLQYLIWTPKLGLLSLVNGILEGVRQPSLTRAETDAALVVSRTRRQDSRSSASADGCV